MSIIFTTRFICQAHTSSFAPFVLPFWGSSEPAFELSELDQLNMWYVVKRLLSFFRNVRRYSGIYRYLSHCCAVLSGHWTLPRVAAPSSF